VSQCHPARRPQHPERHIENEPKLNSKSVRLISHPPLPYYRTSRPQASSFKLKPRPRTSVSFITASTLPGLYLSLFSRLNHARFCVLQVQRPQDLRPGLGDRLGTRLPDLKLSRSSRGFICRVCTSPNPRLGGTILPVVSHLSFTMLFDLDLDQYQA